jgi:hypothetical protein
LASGKLTERRVDQQAVTHNRRHRITWQPKYRLVASLGKDQGLTWFHGQTPQMNLATKGLQGGFYMVVIAHRYPSAGQEHITLIESLLQAACGPFKVIGYERKDHRRGA